MRAGSHARARLHDSAVPLYLLRFLTQAVVDGVLAAATHLRGVDVDALEHLNSKILDSPRLVALGAGGGGAGGYGTAAAGGGGWGAGGSSTAGSSAASASATASGHLAGLLMAGGSGSGLLTAGSGPGGISAPAPTPAVIGRRPSRSPSPPPPSVASAAAAVAAAAMATVASAVRMGGSKAPGVGGGGGGTDPQLSEPLLPAGGVDNGQVAPPSATPFGSLQSVAAHTTPNAAAYSPHAVVVVPSGLGGGGLLLGGPSALEEEAGKDDDAASVFHRPPLQYMPTGLAGFERSALTPEVGGGVGGGDKGCQLCTAGKWAEPLEQGM